MTPSIFSNLPESWSRVCYAARELAIVFSKTFLLFSNNSWSVGQKTPTPQRKVHLHITESSSQKATKRSKEE